MCLLKQLYDYTNKKMHEQSDSWSEFVTKIWTITFEQILKKELILSFYFHNGGQNTKDSNTGKQ